MPRRTTAKTVPITVNIDVELKEVLYREAARRDLVPARCIEEAIRVWLEFVEEGAKE